MNSIVLQKCSLFKNKSINEIEHLLSNINYKAETFSENEIIFSPLQKSDRMGIILSGKVDIQKIFPVGKVVVIERKKSPDLIAEPSVFSSYQYYPVNTVVHKTCKILFIHKTELKKLFTLDMDLTLNFLESVSNSTLILKRKIGILSLNSIQEKIAGFLFHYRMENCKTNDSNIITLPFSKKTWAEYMNVSRTSLSRELRKLENKGIISFEKRIIEVKSWDRLEKILSL